MVQITFLLFLGFLISYGIEDFKTFNVVYQRSKEFTFSKNSRNALIKKEMSDLIGILSEIGEFNFTSSPGDYKFKKLIGEVKKFINDFTLILLDRFELKFYEHDVLKKEMNELLVKTVDALTPTVFNRILSGIDSNIWYDTSGVFHNNTMLFGSAECDSCPEVFSSESES